MSQLRQYQQRWDELNVDIKIIAFDDVVMARRYVLDRNLIWPVLIDTDRRLYSAYGMSPGNWWAIFNPRAIAKYIMVILKGTGPGRPGRDWRQLGGDVLIDPGGIVRLHHVSHGPHDRPAIETIIEIISKRDR